MSCLACGKEITGPKTFCDAPECIEVEELFGRAASYGPMAYVQREGGKHFVECFGIGVLGSSFKEALQGLLTRLPKLEQIEAQQAVARATAEQKRQEQRDLDAEHGKKVQEKILELEAMAHAHKEKILSLMPTEHEAEIERLEIAKRALRGEARKGL
jgi:DNA-directed RNA polymerase subunit F